MIEAHYVNVEVFIEGITIVIKFSLVLVECGLMERKRMAEEKMKEFCGR